MSRLALAAFLLALAPSPAVCSENLVSGLSQDTIQITSSYAGAEIVVFGAIERPQPRRPDIVVVVRGPSADMRVRRKARMAGVWINRNRVVLRGMPTYYFAAANAPLERIAPRTVLEQYGLGLAALMPRSTMGRHDPEPFRKALIRHQRRAGLYLQEDGAVRFLSGTLFRVRVPLPASAPRGRYLVEVYMLREGRVIDARSSWLSIDRTGLERRLYDFAELDPLPYGLCAVLMALALGWLSSLAFRRME
ncbi:MAG TPA: TIGR02186 family protein [Rhizomicrobium sp.]|jgi:uncharacterized protein (TIGR02186 family)|nr:TIGR02186 family protein [Rhizomicrobium sp.]